MIKLSFEIDIPNLVDGKEDEFIRILLGLIPKQVERERLTLDYNTKLPKEIADDARRLQGIVLEVYSQMLNTMEIKRG
jgi:hypothetical protein